ncbi:Atp11p Ecym_2031 [Eremothecium cymbalariae DBVPG|uniref:Uncharacterized protein n=1 Tax=Eremothecium cymbalariae (strain CBS 270.75 / DBVPG 7215 / KCTC 17166 / NRRL Y-17582) TaxID=931890 RepID=G8JNZ0_ERECY|nr:Hypothetical protein Ecym_2031 [Eremothecium cymbalariae DBVPG\
MTSVCRCVKSKLHSFHIRTAYSASVGSLHIQNIQKRYSTIPERYTDKLLQKARERGFKSVEELKFHLKKEIESKKKEFNKIDPLKELEDYEQRMKMCENKGKMTNTRGPIDSSAPQLPFKTLNSFLNVEKMKQLSKQEVEFLWRARWMEKDNMLNAVVPVDVFNKMSSNAKSNPILVLPLPRDIQAANTEGQGEQGIEMHYIQWQFVGPKTVHCIMTSLAEYKLHKGFARPHTTFQFHLDLAEEKKIVLMNGQVETDANISLQEAQLLLLNVQRFYGAMGDHTTMAKARLKILKDFNTGSSDFNVDLLISLSQSMET